MKPKEFEQAVLELAMTTRVPLSRANVLFYTGAASKQAERWLDEMVRNGLLDIDSDDEGELIYVVRGARRPATGATELTRCTACGRSSLAGTRCSRCGQHLDPKLRALRAEVNRGSAMGSLVLAREAQRALSPQAGDKSIAVGGLLGLFGPLGWLYAAPLREALPAAAIFILALKILPSILLSFFILPLLIPASMVVGALYSWKHNQTGRRSGLLIGDEDP